MDGPANADRPGMFEVVDWPDQLTARVVEPGPDPRIHGYAVQGDLARHHTFSDVLYLSLVGEVPHALASRAFDVALTFLSPVPIQDGATHAAALSRLCNAPPRAALAVAAVALTERAQFLLDAHREFCAWLERPAPEPPEVYLAEDEVELARVERLRSVLPRELELPRGFDRLRLDAALICVLHACGLKKPEQQLAVLMMAGLASTFAEAMTTPPLSFRQYAMNTPPFHYRGRDV